MENDRITSSPSTDTTQPSPPPCPPGGLLIGYLEGHDEMGEVKLRLQVQLDGYFLFTCGEEKH